MIIISQIDDYLNYTYKWKKMFFYNDYVAFLLYYNKFRLTFF